MITFHIIYNLRPKLHNCFMVETVFLIVISTEDIQVCIAFRDLLPMKERPGNSLKELFVIKL